LPKLPPNVWLLKLVWLATPGQFTKERTVWPKRSKPSQVSINTYIFSPSTEVCFRWKPRCGAVRYSHQALKH